MPGGRGARDAPPDMTVAAARSDARRTLAASEIAWLLAVPCAAIMVLVVVALGPPLGRFMAPDHPPIFWGYSQFTPRPEPTEHARYLLALLGPVLLSCTVVAAGAWRAWRASIVTTVLVHASQTLTVAFLVRCLLAQRTITYDGSYGGPAHRAFFTVATLVTSLALAAVVVAALRSRSLTVRLRRWTRESPSRRIACLVLAGCATAAWLLTSINVERSVGGVHFGVDVALPWWLDETYAVINGGTPLVDVTSPYSHLWPYAGALTMSLFGTSIGVFTTTMAAGTAAALLAIFATFRRILGNSIAALAVYLPFLATGFFLELGPLDNRYAPSTLLSMFPMRYAGPYLLAWLTARHLDGARPRQTAIVFLVAGFVVINNPEFGIPALGATLVACVLAQPAWTPRALLRVAVQAAAGVAAAAGIVALGTLVRSGSLPDFRTLSIYPRIYGVDGYGMLPMQTVGFHLAIYVTFAAALVVAVARATGQRERGVLTAMLGWSGIFGFGAGSYFAGRSHPEVLIDLFSAWALALVLLLVVAVRAIAARPSRLPSVAELAVLAGVGLAACSVAQTPTPWSQVARLRDAAPPPAYLDREFAQFVARETSPGERVAIIVTAGNWIAHEAGVRNVAPYIGFDWMPLKRQLGETLDALRHANGRKLFTSGAPDPNSDFDRYLTRRGMRPGTVDERMMVWVDRRARDG